MKKILFSSMLFVLVFSSCDFIFGDRIDGNGKIVTKEKNVSSTARIKSMGFFDIELVNDSNPFVSVEADENIIPYIIVENDDDWLIIKTKNHVNLHPSRHIKIKIAVSELKNVELYGSGNILSSNKLFSNSGTNVKLLGSGDIKLLLNTPSISSEITGSGDIDLAGETKDASIKILGAGNYKSSDLKTENTKVEITGSGSATVFADNFLKVNISGSGDVSYKGKATSEQHIAGSGTVKQIQ